MARALQFLSRRELEKTYTVSLQTMAYCAANPNKYASQIRRNAEWLARAQLLHERLGTRSLSSRRHLAGPACGVADRDGPAPA